MSVENIKAFSIIGHKKALDDVCVVLGRSKSFQPDEVSNFYSDMVGFNRATAHNAFGEPTARIADAMKILSIEPRYIHTKKKFKPNFDTIDDYSQKLLNKVQVWEDERAELQEEYNECKRAREETSHFVSIDANIEELLEMDYVKAVFGRMPKENLKKLGTENFKMDYIEFIPCMEEGSYVWAVYFVPVTMYDKADRLFSRLYFEKSTFGDMDEAPEKRYKRLKADVEKLKSKFDQINKKIEDYAKEKEKKILSYYTKASEYNLYLTIRTHAMERGESFVLTGWVSEKKAESIRKRLEKIVSIEVSVSSARDELQLNPPVKLKNNPLTRPFQFYTEMYGVPKYKEIDPTAFIAITYFTLFGIMFGDVGHGLCVILAGAFMWFNRRMAIGKILMPCGFSGMIFGALYGSVFGFENGMDWFYKGILHMEEKPIEVMSSTFTNTILYVAVGIGMSLLCIAMCLNIYTSIRQGNVGKAIFDTSGFCGLIFYGMICAGLVGLMIFNTNLFSVPYIVIIAVAFVLIFLREPLSKLVNGDNDWKPESWGEFVLENLFESLEVLLSYVSNTMSFLRVAAFVLVHAGMMQVVFTLAETAGPVGYWPIFVIGNLLVCALEALLVSIQVLRLEYYEMFSRFYSGEGRPYEPVKLSLVKN
ncbi:MAG: V-type ATPase 116kDa subunit family protein [Ruminococcus sp.]|nr:V-type ATPase 116kDa subunit family protein [Ruminococcus sp.]